MSTTPTLVEEARGRSDRTRQRLRMAGLVVAGYLVAFALWELASSTLFNPYILPGPVAVLSTLWELIVSGEALFHFAASIGKIALGFAIATLIGAPIGVAMGRSRYWRSFFHDPMMVAGNVPGLTYAVFGLVLFGISDVGPVVAVTLVAMPYVALNVCEGVEGVDPHLLELSAVYERPFGSVVRHVLIPSVAPFAFAAVRYGFAMAWKVGALTEVFGGASGIGFQIKHAYQEFSVTGVLAWTAVFVLAMVLIEKVVLARLEARFFSWRGDA